MLYLSCSRKNNTAFPRTSRPAKSASLPSPTYTAGRSKTCQSVDTAAYGGWAEESVVVLPPAGAVTSHDSGAHCGWKSVTGWTRVSANPIC